MTSKLAQMEMDYVASVDGEALKAALRGRGWVSAEVLFGELNLTKRQLRKEAAASRGDIICGNKGYAIIDEVPRGDAIHSAKRLRSQGRKMLDRASRIFMKLGIPPEEQAA